jgi:hypothetical protein
MFRFNFFFQNFPLFHLLRYWIKISLKEAFVFSWSSGLKSTLECWQRFSTLFEVWLFALIGCRFVNIKPPLTHVCIRNYFMKFRLEKIGNYVSKFPLPTFFCRFCICCMIIL